MRVKWEVAVGDSALAIAAAPLACLALEESERNRASELFREYATAMTVGDHNAAAGAIDSIIEELPAKASEIAFEQIAREAADSVTSYLREAESGLAAALKPRDRLRNPEVVADRRLIAEIRQMRDEQALKKRLAEEGWPAMERLQRNLAPETHALIQADPLLRAKRDAILLRLDLADRLARKASLTTDPKLREQVGDIEKGTTALAAIAPSSDRRILEQNEQNEQNERIAGRAGVPAGDTAGVADANRIRILAGLPALVLDPALCRASLIHSTDMAEHGFFSHQSPVPGRASFTDRARETGTTASGENIASGHQTGEAANRAWFHSPGHFKNLFGDHRRIGLGGHEERWTQLFGN